MSSNHKIGNMLEEVKQGIIVQQVNAQGVMGSGIALAIRTKWPKVWEAYSEEIKPNQPDHGKSQMGRVIYVEVEPDLWIANIVGQQFYGRHASEQYTSYEALDDGFASVKEFAEKFGFEVHYPTIGCGLGNGDWSIVYSSIQEHFDDTIVHTLWTLPSK